MISVYLNNGTLFKFKESKIIFENGELLVTVSAVNHEYHYTKELKEVYKVVETMKNCDSLERELYRGELLKRGVEVTVKAECSMNEKGETKWIYY